MQRCMSHTVLCEWLSTNQMIPLFINILISSMKGELLYVVLKISGLSSSALKIDKSVLCTMAYEIISDMCNSMRLYHSCASRFLRGSVAHLSMHPLLHPLPSPIFKHHKR
jgi:hypothetical protein